MKDTIDAIATIVVVIFIAVTLYGWIRSGSTYDNTDNEKLEERSNMRLYTDYGTGNQYISTAFTGLVPRLDARDKQVNIYSNPIKER